MGLEELIEDKPVGGESQMFGKISQRKECDAVQVIPGQHAASGNATSEPDAHRVLFRIMKVGMHGHHFNECHIQAGFFGEFPPRGIPHIFIPFYVAAGNAPGAGKRTARCSPSQQDLIPLLHDDSHTDRGIPVARLAALDSAGTLERLTAEGVIGKATAQRPVAAGRSRPRPRRPVSDRVSDQRR